MIDKTLKNQPVLRRPKTDLIRSVVASSEWNAAIGRRLIQPYPARVLESAISIQSLRKTIAAKSEKGQANLRQLIIVQVDVEAMEAAGRLAVENSISLTPALLMVIGVGLQSIERHCLRCSGVAAVFESFVEMAAIERLVTHYFASLPVPDWSLEQQIAGSL